MRKLLVSAMFLVLAATLAFAIPQQDRDDRRNDDDHHDNGRHEGWEKHGDHDRDHDRDDHHDRDSDDHSHWDYDHDRAYPGRPFPHGHYADVRHVVVFRTIDYRTRRVVLENSTWVVAPYDIDHCRDWRWDRDPVYVYDDDHHPGWYLFFNARAGRYVHVEYFGGR
ncbi:MAG: hypothetical protein WBC04_00435 [Candidatus Acidiferrales bacterium]